VIIHICFSTSASQDMQQVAPHLQEQSSYVPREFDVALAVYVSCFSTIHALFLSPSLVRVLFYSLASSRFWGFPIKTLKRM